MTESTHSMGPAAAAPHPGDCIARSSLSEGWAPSSNEGRDEHFRSGMEAGAARSYDRLAELLKAMAW